jgi:hypothetical protein
MVGVVPPPVPLRVLDRPQPSQDHPPVRDQLFRLLPVDLGGVRPTLATDQAARTPLTADMFKRVRSVVEGVRRRLLVRVDDKSDRT